MQTASLNVLDELYLHLNRKEEPWSVHLELRVQGRIDGKRLQSAVRKAALSHPIARARLADARATDVRYRWEIADRLTSIDLQEIECEDPADLARGRERLLSRTPDLDRAGPFSLLLAHDPGGDALIMNLHHAAGDGLSALRLMGSIARAYARRKDPPATVDALEVRDVNAMAGSGSLKDAHQPRAGGRRLPHARGEHAGADRPAGAHEAARIRIRAAELRACTSSSRYSRCEPVERRSTTSCSAPSRSPCGDGTSSMSAMAVRST